MCNIIKNVKLPLILKYNNKEYLLTYDNIKLFAVSTFTFLSINISDGLLIYIDNNDVSIYEISPSDLNTNTRLYLPDSNLHILNIFNNREEIIDKMLYIRDEIYNNKDVVYSPAMTYILNEVLYEMVLSNLFSIDRDETRLNIAMMEDQLK